jgi:putative ATPase
MATPIPDDTLFTAALNERLARQAPLAARMRPRTLDEVVGQEHLLGPGKPLRALIEADRLSSVILWGPPGTGKTTLARLIAGVTERAFVAMSAVTAGVKDVRETIAAAKQRLGENGQATILFLDEVHRFNKSQQDALLPAVEDGTLTLIGATTENPYFEVNAPLLSRSTLFRLNPLTPEALRTVIKRALDAEQATANDDAIELIINLVDGDARAALTTLEVAIALAEKQQPITVEDVESARSARALRYEEDDHYAIVVADAAARAVEFVGLPEAQLNLAQAVIHLATAPKSNTVITSLGRAMRDVQEQPAGQVPAHLRDAHYQSARRIGHGLGYQYPHDDPRGWVRQQYRPDHLEGRPYYEPSDHGAEAEIKARLKEHEDPAL